MRAQKRILEVLDYRRHPLAMFGTFNKPKPTRSKLRALLQSEGIRSL